MSRREDARERKEWKKERGHQTRRTRVEEGNRREGNARDAKLLMQGDTNRNQDKPKGPIKKMSEV